MRSLLLYAAASVAALGLLSATASQAKAQWVTSTYVPVQSYYYAPPPVYYPPVPVTTSYYAPVTYSSYYAPAPAPVVYSSYYAPVAAPVVPAPVAVYRPAWLFRPRVVYRY